MGQQRHYPRNPIRIMATTIRFEFAKAELPIREGAPGGRRALVCLILDTSMVNSSKSAIQQRAYRRQILLGRGRVDQDDSILGADDSAVYELR
jgi:hypothetical protein